MQIACCFLNGEPCFVHWTPMKYRLQWDQIEIHETIELPPSVLDSNAMCTNVLITYPGTNTHTRACKWEKNWAKKKKLEMEIKHKKNEIRGVFQSNYILMRSSGLFWLYFFSARSLRTQHVLLDSVFNKMGRKKKYSFVNPPEIPLFCWTYYDIKKLIAQDLHSIHITRSILFSSIFNENHTIGDSDGCNAILKMEKKD